MRRIELTDWRDVHAWACLPEACRFQLWGPNTEEQTHAFVVSAVEAWTRGPQSRFAFTARLAEAVVGMGELRIRNTEQCQGEIAYIVHPKMWGAGVGTAIGTGLLRHGFETLGLHRIYATCDPRNVASARVLRKLGMTLEGRLRHVALIRDGWRDSELFSILEYEWHSPLSVPHLDATDGDRPAIP